MKKLLFFLLFLPVTAYADTITFIPGSPVVFDGTSNATFDFSGGHPVSVFPANNIGKADNGWIGGGAVTGCAFDSGVCGFNWGANQTIQAYSGQTAGTMKFVSFDLGASQSFECTSAGKTYSDCAGSDAYVGDLADYVMTSPSPPPPPTPSTTPSTVIDDPAEQLFDAMVLFIVSMAFMIWLMRK